MDYDDVIDKPVDLSTMLQRAQTVYCTLPPATVLSDAIAMEKWVTGIREVVVADLTLLASNAETYCGNTFPAVAAAAARLRTVGVLVVDRFLRDGMHMAAQLTHSDSAESSLRRTPDPPVNLSPLSTTSAKTFTVRVALSGKLDDLPYLVQQNVYRDGLTRLAGLSSLSSTSSRTLVVPVGHKMSRAFTLEEDVRMHPRFAFGVTLGAVPTQTHESSGDTNTRALIPARCMRVVWTGADTVEGFVDPEAPSCSSYAPEALVHVQSVSHPLQRRVRRSIMQGMASPDTIQFPKTECTSG